MADKIIGLDLSKRDGFNKAITGRVGDKGQSYLFKLFNNGLLFDLEQAESIALLGLTPSGYYVDAVGFPQEDGNVKVDLPSAFNAEMGYFQRCFIRVTTKDGEILSTQDLIYYSYGNADISAGGGADYIGRVEDLINQLNEAADEFEDGLNTKYNALVQKMQDTTDALEALQQQMADLISQGAITKPQADSYYMGINHPRVTNQDWNTLVKIGTYSVENATGANKPSISWGTLLVQGGTQMITQLAIASGKMYYRRQLGDATSWGNWFEVGNASDFYKKTETYNRTEIDNKLANVKPTVATGAEVNLGTDNSKTVTPKALADSTYIKYAEGETIAKNSIESDKASMLANKQLFMINSSNSTYIKGGSIKLERVGDTCFMSGIINTSVEIPTNVSILTSGTLPEWFNSDSNRNAISIFAGKLTNCFFEYNTNTIKIDSQAVPAGSWMALNASAFPAKTHM